MEAKERWTLFLLRWNLMQMYYRSLWNSVKANVLPFHLATKIWRLQVRTENHPSTKHSSTNSGLDEHNAYACTFSIRPMYPWFSTNQVFLLLTSVPPWVTSAHVHVTLHAFISKSRKVLIAMWCNGKFGFVYKMVIWIDESYFNLNNCLECLCILQ